MCYQQLIQNALTETKRYFVISYSKGAKTHIFEKMEFISSKVVGLVVDDPQQLYWLNTYDVDGIIVSDCSGDAEFANAAHRILQDVSPDSILLSEGKPIIDENIASNIYSQYDGYFRSDANVAEIQLIISNALVKKETKNRDSQFQCVRNNKIFQRISAPEKSFTWQDFTLGIFWIIITVAIAVMASISARE